MKNFLITVGNDLGLPGPLPAGEVGLSYSATLTAYGADYIELSLVSENSGDTFSLVDNGDNTCTITSSAELTEAGLFTLTIRLKDNERRQTLVRKLLTVAAQGFVELHTRITEDGDIRITEDGNTRVVV